MSDRNDSGLGIALSNLLNQIGEDVQRDGLVDTPCRFEKQIRECLVGYADDPIKYVKLFDNPDFHDLILVSKISFSSLCEHHLLPFSGFVDIGYIPTDKILGLSKFARIVDSFSKRLQVQERLTHEIAGFLNKHLDPTLLIVRIKASHSCMTIRGVQRPQSITETVIMLGDDRNNRSQVEYFQYVAGKE